MRIYSLMRPAAGSGAYVVAVREGFCLPAFLFGPLWLLARGMWAEAALVVLMLLLTALLPPAHGALAAALLFWLLGLEGNGLHRRALRRRGYAEAGIVAAADADQALLMAFANDQAAPS